MRDSTDFCLVREEEEGEEGPSPLRGSTERCRRAGDDDDDDDERGSDDGDDRCAVELAVDAWSAS